MSMGGGDGVGVGGRFGCGGGGLVVKGVQWTLGRGRFRGSEAIVSHMSVGDGTGGRSEGRLERRRNRGIMGGFRCGSRGRRCGGGLISLGIPKGGKWRGVGRRRRRKRKRRGWKDRLEREGRQSGRPAFIHYQTEGIGRGGGHVKMVTKVEILVGCSGCGIVDRLRTECTGMVWRCRGTTVVGRWSRRWCMNGGLMDRLIMAIELMPDGLWRWTSGVIDRRLA